MRAECAGWCEYSIWGAIASFGRSWLQFIAHCSHDRISLHHSATGPDHALEIKARIFIMLIIAYCLLPVLLIAATTGFVCIIRQQGQTMHLKSKLASLSCSLLPAAYCLLPARKALILQIDHKVDHKGLNSNRSRVCESLEIRKYLIFW